MVEAAVGRQAQVEVRITLTRRRVVERGAQGSGDGAHVIASVQTDGCALDREGSARGSGAPVPWEGAGCLFS